jgi:N-acetyl-anhydromuramyl-L-alanine amidase AmpD
MRPIDQLVVHCAATRPDQDIGAAEIDAEHRAQGWDCIGYHFVIRRSGILENGRSVDRVGAHVKGHNAFSIGICLVGGVDANNKAENNFTPAQFDTLKALLSRLRLSYADTEILGHRDFSPDLNNDGEIEPSEWIKECPCFNVMEWCRGVGIDPQTQVRE